ncbi:hypothetical protein ES702_02471 [subsurface metagenome]
MYNASITITTTSVSGTGDTPGGEMRLQRFSVYSNGSHAL